MRNFDLELGKVEPFKLAGRVWHPREGLSARDWAQFQDLLKHPAISRHSSFVVRLNLMIEYIVGTENAVKADVIESMPKDGRNWRGLIAEHAENGPVEMAEALLHDGVSYAHIQELAIWIYDTQLPDLGGDDDPLPEGSDGVSSS